MKHFFNKPFVFATLISLALLLASAWWLGGPWSSLASDGRWLVVALVFCYCLFCWLGLAVFAWGPVGWARTDYAWIAMAVLALCTSQLAGLRGLHLTGPLMAGALALRVARSRGEITLRARQGRTLWLIADGHLQVPADDLLEVKLQRVKDRLRQVLHNWRTAGLPVVHVRVQDKLPATTELLPSAQIRIEPAFRECEFTYSVQQPLDDSELGRFLARQPVDCLYLFGVQEARLVERLQRWGRQRKVEVLVDEGLGLRGE